MIGLKVEQALEQSRTLLLVMSANAFASEWVTLERHTALFRDPTNAHRRFIPLRLDDAEIKDALKQFSYVDWRERSDGQYVRLLAVCNPPIMGELVMGQKETSQLGKVLKGHVEYGVAVAVTADGRLAISGSGDNTVRVWELETEQCLITLEGHTGPVYGVALAADGRRAVSGSVDKSVRVWELPSYEKNALKDSEATCYINAKVVLVGDKGVGKTGLGVRLAEGEWRPSPGSTHGMNVWTLHSEPVTRGDVVGLRRAGRIPASASAFPE
jgi:WD40 repeat protein